MIPEIVFPDQILKKRGLLDEAKALGWTVAGDRWRYPVWHYVTGAIIGTRSKRITGEGAKYLWVPSKPADPAAEWYIVPDALSAIRRAQGVCYLANGEAALVACRAAGLYNAIATTTSEASIPGNLRDVLSALGIRELRLVADNDEAGHRSAKKWRDAVTGCKVSYQALDLSGMVDHKGDLNDLWMVAGFDPALFHHYVENLPALLLPADEAPAKQRQRQQVSSPDASSYVDAIRQAVEGSGLLQGRAKADGWHQIICPFHEDKRPSASFNAESAIIHCFVCGTHKRDEVAERFGVDQSRYLATDKRDYTKRSKAGLDKAPVEDAPVIDLIAPEVLTADHFVNVQYLTDAAGLVGRTGCYAIQSDKGTGKTELAVRLVDSLREDVSSVLVVAPYVSLVHNSAERYGLDVYNGLNHQQQRQAPYLAITQKSLKNLAGSDRVNNTDVLILDELTTGLLQLESRELYTGTEANQAYAALAKIVQTAKLVLVIDADLNQPIIDWLRAQRSDVTVIRNDYRRALGKLTVFDRQQALDDTFFSALSAPDRQARPVAYVANSRAQIERIEAAILKHYPALRVLSVTSANSKNSNQRAFITAPDTEAANYDAILLSPAVATGIDIQTRFYAKFGHFTASHEAPAAAGCAQLFERIRTADQCGIWIKKAVGHAVTDGATLYQQQKAKALDTYNSILRNLSDSEKDTFALLYPLDDKGHPDFPAEQRQFYRLLADLRALRNTQYNALKPSLLGIFAENYDLVTSDSASNHHGEAILQASKEAKEAYQQMVLTVAPVSKDEYDRLEAAHQITAEVEAGYERWKIEDFYNQTISEDLLTFDQRGKGRQIVRQFEDATGVKSLDELREADRAEIVDGVPLEVRRHRYKKAIILQAIILQLWGEAQNQVATLQQAPAVTEDELTRRAVLALSLLDRRDRLYFDGRLDLDESALLTCKRWLRKMGVYLVTRRLRDGDELTIDTDRLGYLVALVQQRQQVSDEGEDGASLQNSVLYI